MTIKKSFFNTNLDYGVNWWFNPDIKESYSIFNLDTFYEKKYFKKDHVNKELVNKYVQYILSYGKEILGRDIKTIIEVGAGTGWFTKEFINKGLDIVAIEGSKEGYYKMKKRINKKYWSSLIKHDLRLPIDLKRKFDIAVCTEVAEHIEPPFSSQLIQTLILHSDLIWFSFEKPLTNPQHYHHSNEQPEVFWKNLFNFYSFEMLKLPKKIYDDLASRGGYIFYNKKLNIPERLKRYSELETKSTNMDSKTWSILLKIKNIMIRFLLYLSNKIERLAYKFIDF